MPRISPRIAASHSEAQRERILAAARELFASEGYEAVSMRKIARLIDQSPTTIYLYFRDKRALVTCISEEFFAYLVAALQDEMEAAADIGPLEALERGLRCYIRAALAHPSHYRAALLNPMPCGETEEIKQGDMSKAAQEFLVGAVARVLPPETTPERIAATASACWAALHGLVSVLIIAPDCFGSPPEATIEAMLSLIAKGLTD